MLLHRFIKSFLCTLILSWELWRFTDNSPYWPNFVRELWRFTDNSPCWPDFVRDL